VRPLDAFIRLATHDGQPTPEGYCILLPPGDPVFLAVQAAHLGPFLQRWRIAT
jgi:hypothetical protein